MAPREWSQVVEVFHAARERSGLEQVTLLDAVCGEGTPLRRAVEKLLRANESAEGFLSGKPFSLLGKEICASLIVPGQTFKRFVTVALLGGGGMGEVWSAWDTELDRQVALKFLRPESTFGIETEQITREAKAASALNHPNIVTIYEVVHSESSVAIAMELIEGTPLGQFRETSVSTPEVLSIGLQIAEALAAAHSGGIIHGDIKPENILLRQDRYVKLLDFGLASRVTTEAIASPALGTLRYMSPEQARGEQLTPGSDVFSFGLVLYELATGIHAFPASSPFDTMRAILTKEPQWPSSVNHRVPTGLSALILAMLSKDLAVRPSAEEVAKAIVGLQSRQKISPSVFRAPWMWTAAAALLVTVSILTVPVLWQRSHHPTVKFLQTTFLIPDSRATAAAISPNGALTAFANADGIFLQTADSSAISPLPSPQNYTFDRLAWFSDGTRLIASGFSKVNKDTGIWLISSGAPPRLLRQNGGGNAVPSPDSSHIAFLSKDQDSIWIMDANGESARPALSAPPGDTFPLVFWSPDSRRIAYGRRRHHATRPHISEDKAQFDLYYERSYESLYLSSAKVVARVADMWLDSAAALPDGRVLFLRWVRDESDYPDQLWEVQTNPSTGAFIGQPRRVTTLDLNKDYYDHVYGMSSTTDGQKVLVLRRSDQPSVFVADFDAHLPGFSGIRRLTFDDRSSSFPHAWTADSRNVIYESNRRGTFDLYRQVPGQPTPQVIVATPDTEFLPQLAPGGTWVLYVNRPSNSPTLNRKLMRVPVEGGAPEEVPVGGALDEFRCALGPKSRCVLRTSTPEDHYTYFDLDPLQGKGRELASTRWAPEIPGDWDVSPDGHFVAIPLHSHSEGRIRIVALDASKDEEREREVVLPGMTDLHGLVWAADGNSWFVTVETTIGNRKMLLTSLDGHSRPLGEIHGWAVPSPDGKRVAFLDRIIATNAWLIDRHR